MIYKERMTHNNKGMGNRPSAANDTIIIPKWERSLQKNYNCHYYLISSDPSLFQKRKCLVLDHDEGKFHYTLRDLELDLVYEDVPSVFVSSSLINYSWEDYFKVGTVVKTNATSLDKGDKKLSARARISDMRYDPEDGVTVDLVDMRTGFRAFRIAPHGFALDKAYYKIK